MGFCITLRKRSFVGETRVSHNSTYARRSFAVGGRSFVVGEDRFTPRELLLVACELSGRSHMCRRMGPQVVAMSDLLATRFLMHHGAICSAL